MRCIMWVLYSLFYNLSSGFQRLWASNYLLHWWREIGQLKVRSLAEDHQSNVAHSTSFKRWPFIEGNEFILILLVETWVKVLNSTKGPKQQPKMWLEHLLCSVCINHGFNGTSPGLIQIETKYPKFSSNLYNRWNGQNARLLTLIQFQLKRRRLIVLNRARAIRWSSRRYLMSLWSSLVRNQWWAIPTLPTTSRTQTSTESFNSEVLSQNWLNTIFENKTCLKPEFCFYWQNAQMKLLLV